MQMHKLEAKEILRYLGPGCDEDIVTSLEVIAGLRDASGGVTIHAADTTVIPPTRLPRALPDDLHPENIRGGVAVQTVIMKEAPDPGKLQDGSPALLTLEEANRHVKILKLSDMPPDTTQEQLDELNRKRIWTQEEVDTVNLQRKTSWAAYKAGQQQRGYT